MELQPEYNEYRISVPQEFENVFTHFYFAENNSEIRYQNTFTHLSDYFLFCFGENATMSTREKTIVEVAQCMVFGPVRQAFDYTLPAGCSILVASFKDDAFSGFLGRYLLNNR
jgi:hypothetical protein